MKLFSALMLFSFLLSCSRINTESQTYYKTQKKSSFHGLRFFKEDEDHKSFQKQKSAAFLKMQRNGRLLYEKHCLKCHGMTGKGDGPLSKNLKKKPSNLGKLSLTNRNFNFYIDNSVKTRNMPGWKVDFTEQELIELTYYLKKLIL